MLNLTRFSPSLLDALVRCPVCVGRWRGVLHESPTFRLAEERAASAGAHYTGEGAELWCQSSRLICTCLVKMPAAPACIT